MTHPDLTATLTTAADDSRDADGDHEAPRLVVALESRRPSAPGLRVSLAGLGELALVRGAARGVTRTGATAELALPDAEMSRRHARLRRHGDGWEVVDLGSKNGTNVNGAAVTRTALLDGDVVEVGGTMLVFRDDPGRGADLADRDLAGDDAPLAFRTVSLDVERLAGDLAKLAPSTVPVLIRGETGTGKELVARGVHDLSGRRGAFVPVNCGALPRTLIESELFGYRRGAFSGARDDRDGLVRRAHGGTLFLDEIAELPEESQVALLRVLQEGEVRPVGASDAVSVDIRVIAATHQDLDARIAAGRFRQDLYARLAGFQPVLPPLRERREDVGSLVAALLPRLGVDTARVTFHRAAARALLRHDYPLNIRELEQALRAAVVLAEGREVRVDHLPEAMRAPPTAAPGGLRPEERALRDRLVEVLRDARGNVTAAGRALGKAPVQIRRWCRRFGVDPASFRGG